jgi:transposase-like protein
MRNLNCTTDLGYAAFRCGDCGRKSNERTGTPFNFVEFPTDIVFEIVLCRLLYKLSLRNLAQMFLLRGFEFTHEAVREWEERFAPLLAEQIRRKRKGKVGRRWYVDETYLKVKGKWCYLYRAIDRDGNLVDSMLSATRDMYAAQRFFRSAQSVANTVPTQVTTDGHDSYPRAIRETLGAQVKHRCSAYANRRIERDHRGIKQRYYPMLGFGALPSAQRFCRAFEYVRQYFRLRRKQKQVVSLAQGRRRFLFRALALESLFLAA